MFFDGEEGVLVYLSNVRLRNPQFDLECREQLKIFLESEERGGEPTGVGRKPGNPGGDKAGPAGSAGAAGEPAAGAGEEPGGGDKLFGGGRFGSVRQIVATGAVQVTRKDPNGEPVTATADSAIYEAASGDVILRGGFPTVRQGRSALIAKQPGLYVRLYRNGNVYTQPGKWETVAANLRERQELKPNP
jgi:hypothetical protein